MCQFLYS